MKNFEGYLKKKFGDNYVLLAGGSHKSLSDFAMANAYLPLSGGTMTGPIYFGLPSTNTTILAYNSDYPKFGIWYNEGEYDTMKLSASGNADTDAGADLCINGNGDGTVTIRGNTILHTGNYNTWAAAKSHTHSYIEAKGNYTFDSSTLPNSFDYGISAGFVNSNSGFGSYGSVLTVRTYSGGGGTLQLYAPYSNTYGGDHLKARFGNYEASSGNSWTTLKTIAWTSDLSSYLPLSGGTMTGALTVKLYIFGYNYNHAGGNAPAFVFDKPGSNYTGIGANGETDTIYFSAATLSNGEASWVTSYKQKWKFNGTIYQEGNAVIHAGNIGSQRVTYATTAGSAPASDVYSWAKASTKPSYTFGEIGAGVATIGDGANYVLLRSNSSWYTGMYYNTTGDEAFVFANVNERTSWMFATTNPTSRTTWTSLTPALLIKKNCVYINSLIANGTTPSYNFYVNGSSYLAGNSIVSGSLTVNSGIELGHTNEINGSSSPYNLHLNYRVSGLVSICYGGGNCGVGTNSPSYKLHINGNCGASNFYTTSDIKKKKNIHKISKLLPIVEFDWKESGEHSYGFIAQELESLGYLELVSGKEEKTVNYNAALSLCVAQLSNIVEDNKLKIKELEAKILELERRIYEEF